MVKSKGKAVDEVHLPHMTPTWVLRLAQRWNSTEPCFIMAKTLTNIDLDAGQNRGLLFPYGFVTAHLIPFLSDEERAAANFLDQGRKPKRPSTVEEEEDLQGWETKNMTPAESDGRVPESGEGETSKKKKEGLRVAMYVGACMGKAYLTLTHWDASNGTTILKGNEYSRYLAKWSGIQVGDKVELWGFREGETGRPCFVLHKIREKVIEWVQGWGSLCLISEEQRDS